MTTAELVHLNEILRTTVGSGVHGIAIKGTDDNDEMGIFIEPAQIVLGPQPALDHYVWRTQPEGVRSGPGDTDLVCYSLRKYLRLAIKGNPTVLLPLFAPDVDVLRQTSVGTQLRAMRSAFLSQQAAQRFLGYMASQHQRMLGNGRRSSVPNRPELIARYGWDVKYGSHALRLGYQCYEIVSTGHLTLPLPDPQRNVVLEVKTGQWDREVVSAEISRLEAAIRAKLKTGATPLPPEADVLAISEWSMRAHFMWWGGGR